VSQAAQAVGRLNQAPNRAAFGYNRPTWCQAPAAQLGAKHQPPNSVPSTIAIPESECWQILSTRPVPGTFATGLDASKPASPNPVPGNFAIPESECW